MTWTFRRLEKKRKEMTKSKDRINRGNPRFSAVENGSPERKEGIVKL